MHHKIMDIWACFDYDDYTILSYDRFNNVYLISNNNTGKLKTFSNYDVRIEGGYIQFTDNIYNAYPEFFKQGGD